MPASAESRTLTITESGSPALELKDVLVGEVWLASGQSQVLSSGCQISLDQQNPEGAVFTCNMADGMGGHANGARAAELTIEMIEQVFLAQNHPVFDPQGFLHLAIG